LYSGLRFNNERKIKDGPVKILRFPDLKPEKGIPWTRVHIARLEKAGKFPKRVHLSANTIGWFDTEIDEMLRQRAAERPTA
jgi:prophage regulatory protein